MTHQPDTARALLHRHGLPEDVIGGVLALHAQELADVQRRDAAVWGVDTAAGKHRLAAADLITPTEGAVSVASAGQAPATARAALRDRIAAALAREDAHNAGYDHGFAASYGADEETDGFVDAVLAVLPAPADQAAVIAHMDDAQAAAAIAPLEAAVRRHREQQRTAHQVAVLRAAADDLATAFGDPAVKHIGGLGAAHLRRRAQEIESGQAAALRRLADEAQSNQTEGDEDLPARLKALLTERYTALGNPFSEMRRHEQGPDGWPASHPVGPHHVAEALRELLAPPSAGPGAAAHGDEPRSLPCSGGIARQSHGPHDWEPQPGMTPIHCPGTAPAKEA
jgi:hypothetical protein